MTRRSGNRSSSLKEGISIESIPGEARGRLQLHRRKGANRHTKGRHEQDPTIKHRQSNPSTGTS